MPSIVWLLLTPLATLLYAVRLSMTQGPSGVDCPDPGYYILMNALNLLEGHSIRYIEHPGVPLQAFGAAVIRTVYAMVGSGGIVFDLIQHPGTYVTAFFIPLAVLYAVALTGLGYVAWRRTGSVAGAVAIEAVPHLLGNWTKVKPITAECLLVTVAAVLLILILRGLDDRSRPIWRALTYGAVIGFGVAVKLNFAPLALVPLLLFRSLEEVVGFVTAIVVAFMLFTAPIWSEYPRLAQRVIELAVHQGKYGFGPMGIAPLSTWLLNLAGLSARNPAFAALLIAATLILARRLFGQRTAVQAWTPADRLFVGVTLCGLAQFLMTAKQPDSYYLLPARATTGLLLWLIIERWPWARLHVTERRLLWIGVAPVVLLVVVALVRRAPDAAAIQQHLDANYANAAKVFYSGATSVAYALQRGHWMAGAPYTDTLSRVYPNTYFYHGSACCWPPGSAAGIFDWSGQPVRLSDIKRERTAIVFVGAPLVHAGSGGPGSLPDDDDSLSPAPVQLQEVFRRGDEAIYEFAGE